MSQSWRPERIRAVVLDWAGTTVDHGSRAPVVAVTQAFAARGVALTEADARGPMGIAKREHIRRLLALPSVREAWRSATGREPGEDDAADLYASFEEFQVDAIVAHGEVIPGVPDAIARLRGMGIAIGSTTGYVRPAAEAAAAVAAAQGYAPDVIVAVDEVPVGRPEPWMLLKALQALRIHPPSAAVKVGDTPVDMAEGRNAGAWAVGVAETGNELGLGVADLAALPATTRQTLVADAEARLLAAGAHIVVASVADLPAAIETIDGWLRSGLRP